MTSSYCSFRLSPSRRRHRAEQSEKGYKSVEEVPTWEQKCRLNNIYLLGSAKGRVGHTQVLKQKLLNPRS
ncbi:hypothetical protein JOQ06_022326 [Pogonophryne albipinna]|uniref:Uncharacterized protein n=1 Tax=Pogonophryne albipinna TaxID=1090488 RepID=A0AAD6A6Z0_9TELE|nr:hypothetical protein JOQ06_022326 [Pogonophryne albipinna]